MKRFCIGFSAVLLACGSAGSSQTTAVTAQAAASVPHGRAFGLAMNATSCWMGGLWADALGESYDSRNEGIDRRCADVVRALEAPTDFERPLRAIDETAVNRVAAKVHETAEKDSDDRGHARDLEAFFDRVAGAMRENQHARLAADRVKDDAAQSPAPETYGADKNEAAGALAQHDAMRALLDDRGPYAAEARAVGLLVALDRMEIAHKLPKHLKLITVGPAYAAVFGVASPAVTGAPADRSPPGVWLSYLSDVARAAGRPVPADLVALPDRETYAWSAVLAGFADRLRAEPAFGAPDTRLGEVVRNVVARLDDAWRTEESLSAAKRKG